MTEKTQRRPDGVELLIPFSVHWPETWMALSDKLKLHTALVTGGKLIPIKRNLKAHCPSPIMTALRLSF